jgi:hypothetical protein
MKYKIILLFLLTSCANHTYSIKNNFSYTGKGFAVVTNQSFDNLDNNKFFVSHNKLKVGTKLKITNPANNVFVETIVRKKIKYDNFYKVLISKDIAEKLDLDLNFPYVEVTEIKKNKSFIAKKAVTNSVEKKIANTAPVAKISIDNLAKKTKPKKTKLKTYSILVADFSTLESAALLKIRLETILKKSNYHLIYINKNNHNSYKLLMGPYNTINKLKNDYIVLNDSDFEDLDIIINDKLY